MTAIADIQLGHAEEIIADRDEPKRVHLRRVENGMHSEINLCGAPLSAGHLCPHYVFIPDGGTITASCECGVPVCAYCLTLAGAL